MYIYKVTVLGFIDIKYNLCVFTNFHVISKDIKPNKW